MEIYSFTGKSGTGKSYSAARICREKHIDAIIDDGLLMVATILWGIVTTL